MSVVDPLPAGGISSGLAGGDDTLPGRPRWDELANIRAIVGQCRVCQGSLQAIVADPAEAGVPGGSGGAGTSVRWYEARCLSCGKEVAAPNGRALRRSALASEQPRGWAERRAARDAEHAHGGATPDSPPRRRRDRSY